MLLQYHIHNTCAIQFNGIKVVTIAAVTRVASWSICTGITTATIISETLVDIFVHKYNNEEQQCMSSLPVQLCPSSSKA